MILLPIFNSSEPDFKQGSIFASHGTGVNEERSPTKSKSNEFMCMIANSHLK